MPRFVTATVTSVLAQRPGLQRVEVDGHPAYVLTDLIGPVAVGDRVVVNTTAVDLGLGSGGSHVVHWNLAREVWDRPGPGHIMKLRYTSLQANTGAAEDQGPFYPATSLAGMPVVACDLHSQVACVALAFSRRAPGRRLVYVMTDSAALPLVFSDTVADLRARKVLAATVSSGQAFGGDFEAVNVHSALEVADVMAGADAVVVGPGPGVVGTGTGLGFSGIEVVGVADAAARLGGRPIVAVRYSDADPRPEHRGVSHHTVTCLNLASKPVPPNPVLVAVPRGQRWSGPTGPGIDTVEVDVGEGDTGEGDTGEGDTGDEGPGGLTTMGRRADQDPGFFRWSAAAGALAARLLSTK